MAFRIFKGISQITTKNMFIKSCSQSFPETVRIISYQIRKIHWNRSKEDHGKRVLNVILPEVSEWRLKEKLSVEEIRSSLKEKGINPHKDWKEKPMYVTCTGRIMDPYVPPKGDGKMSFISQQSIKQQVDTIEMKGRSLLAFRKIRNVDLNFDLPTLLEKGKEIYIEAQKALSERNEDKLHDLVTDRAYEEMMEIVRLRTIRWNFIQSLEPPRIVHIRCTDAISAHNLFAQVTVRLFTRQTLAVYDRFGRLIHGSENTVKDALEYAVFEKHITSPHGSWKLHGKILPRINPPESTSSDKSQKIAESADDSRNTEI